MPQLLRNTGIFMILLGVVHVALVGSAVRPWEGVSGLRKPILFFVSTGLTVWSIGWIRSRRYRIQEDHRLIEAVTGYALAMGLTLEVLLIAVQSWLGLRSHFNHDTPWSTGVEVLMLLAIALATLIIYRETWIAWTNPKCIKSRIDSEELCAVRSDRGDLGVGEQDKLEEDAEKEMQLAIRWGLLFLSISCLIGFAISYWGWHQKMDGLSPETYGKSGSFKFPHGVTIHAVQTLPLIAFLHNWRKRTTGGTKSTFGGLFRRSPLNPTAWGILAHLLLLGYAVRQTLRGWGRIPADTEGSLLLMLTIAASLLAALIVGFRLWSSWINGRKRAKLDVID